MRGRGERDLVTALVLLACAGVPCAAQPEALATRVFTLRHQPVGDAVSLIVPQLSDRGGVELRPGGTTLVIRDVPETLDRIMPLLEDFDQPALAIRVEIRIVSAGAEEQAAAGANGESAGLTPNAVSPNGLSPNDLSKGELPAELLERLRQLLRYRSYRLLAGDAIETREGGEVSHALGADYRVVFKLGRLSDDRRIRLQGFRIYRGGPPPESPELDAAAAREPLIHTNINLRVDRPMVLGLARTESSERALMVVLECAQSQAPEG